jgi:iron complex outermembrane receptor protein
MRVQHQCLLAVVWGFATGGALAADGAANVGGAGVTGASSSAGSSTSGSSASADTGSLDEVVVTARRREESLQNVPIAVTALSAQMLLENQINSVKDIAAYSPGLNINSDSAGRSFVSIRGIGTTLINTVQPGVGIFLDGIYQPDTSYLNSPIVDVERIEVLRGPQGTLFGNNTLGGAINVITRQPTDTFQGFATGAYAGNDNYYSAAVSISGPIIPGILQGRIALADHSQDGFGHNTVAGSYANPLNSKSANTTLRFEPTDSAVFTLNAYYNRIFGGSTAYSQVDGPTDYQNNTDTNLNNTVTLYYKGANLKGVFDVQPLATTITAVVAYDRRDDGSRVDGDYSPIDFLRASGVETLETKTGELRFDTRFTDDLSTLFGVFANRIATDQSQLTTLNTFLPPPYPPSISVPTASTSEANQQALYGTAFWKFLNTWEVTAGLRYDHQVLGASNDTTAGDYRASNWEPRLTIKNNWTPDFMTYASIARGVRGGGQNGPGAPNLIYRGDSVVTTELGTKMTLLDRRLTIDTDIFYNNYVHFIGQNSLAPSTGGVGFVAINLNTGQVHSYGAEFESHFKATDAWRIDGGLTLLHARVTNGLEYQQTTGMALATDRVLFTPDWNYDLDTSYTLPVNGTDSMEFMVGAVGKGSRVGSALSSTVVPVLSAYTLLNASITYHLPRVEVALFATNLTNRQYFESYIDKSSLLAAGLPPTIATSSLGVMGDLRRVGVRGKWSF